jgi:zinc carboxypeptidase
LIDVEEVLRAVPAFDSFCSVEQLRKLVEAPAQERSPVEPTAESATESIVEVEVAGTSAAGVPIHHVRCGTGAVKALIVAGAHAMEPIGSLTVFSLITLLQQHNPALLAADVEWHIVPCIDPDGALLNEGWSQKPFTLENLMRNYYCQPPQDEVDMSFPISYKNLAFDQATKEAKILQSLIDRIRPDFYVSFHNVITGGALFFLTRDIGDKYYRQIHALLKEHGLPVQRRPPWREFCARFDDGIVEIFTMKKNYDYLERTTYSPEGLMQFGATSVDYLAEVNPAALAFVPEVGYVRHPSDESERETGESLRRLKLRVDADCKYLATTVLEEWHNVKADLDADSPFYRAMVGYFLATQDRISEGGIPLSMYPTREYLFSPEFGRTMTEADRFNALTREGLFFYLPFCFQLLRLLETSRQSAAVKASTARLEEVFESVLADTAQAARFDLFEIVDYNTMAKVQLGSTLIALNSVLETRTKT